MKFELDTENKTIKLKEEVNLNDFFTKIDDLLGEEWGDYTLIMGEKVEYVYKNTPPISPPPYPPITDPKNLPNIYC
jgi:hypothetical protein